MKNRQIFYLSLVAFAVWVLMLVVSIKAMAATPITITVGGEYNRQPCKESSVTLYRTKYAMMRRVTRTTTHVSRDGVRSLCGLDRLELIRGVEMSAEASCKSCKRIGGAK